MLTQINWDSFSVYNQDARGIRYKFEDLCRQLFANENLPQNKQYKYLHSNPSNAGLETDPIYDETNNRWIGFQAKYFDLDVDYNQIKHSAENAIRHYAGKLDHIYLFSNKPLTLSAKGYIDTVNMLHDSNISLEPITNEAILDLVRHYPYLGLYYFGNHTIAQDWFVTHTTNMFDELGERYNRVFNVGIGVNDELSLFVHDQSAANYINEKKTKVLKRIEALYWRKDEYRPFFKTIIQTVDELPDVNIHTLCESIKWKERIVSAVAPFLTQYNDTREKLKMQRDEQYKLAYDSRKNKEEETTAYKKYREIEILIQGLDSIVAIPNLLEITDRERQLICGDVLTVFGEAGTGKSQLLAFETKQLIDAGRVGLLLIAGQYYTFEPIQEQIMKNLRFDYRLDDLIDILEAFGEKDNCIIPIFIDALNETWNRQLWKSGLSAIIEKIKRTPMVKLILSYRPEYENYILPDSVRLLIQSGAVVTIHHRGFEDTGISAIREFLNHYSIPFTPLEYFGYEMSNPLFLTLYCKTYNGEEISLPTLYERLLKHANINIYKAMEKELNGKGYSEDDDILKPLINEIALVLVSHNERSISHRDIVKLDFWSEYGFSPAPFIKQLIREHILHNSIFEDKERFYFTYDQMNDYYCAKAILDKYSDKTGIRQYLTENVLGIRNGKLENAWNIDLFVNACALYAAKFDEECIDIIDSLSDDYDKWSVFSRFIASFQWRDSEFISIERFMANIQHYPCKPGVVWDMLIGNSVKVSSPLNIDFLHNLLSSYELNRRDHLWTLYINDLTNDDSDRIIQLVQMYDRGEKLAFKDGTQVELLLTLFGWLLTSSNRWLRDYSSKAMIELLKDHFRLCRVILHKFESVNDPYVVQRLFGIVFGACCKKNEAEFDDFKDLAEYVYNTIFNKELVYPDILLRDYARMIIERFLYENPDYKGIINHMKIVPPYKSVPIPEIEDQQYLEKAYDGAISWLMHSMRFEGMGMYGDFGRYVFQSALRNFDVEDKKLFNYAVYFILNELKYSEEYFSEHDKHCGSLDRHQTSKTERIGKKYQWIAMYNVLARVSDHHRMIDKYSSLDEVEIPYEGAWEPYVRDFDPTLNQHFMVCADAPSFNCFDDFITAARDENAHTDVTCSEQQTTWLEAKGIFHQALKGNLLLRDENGTEWVTLSAYLDTGTKDLDTEKLLVWSWLYAYFVTPEQRREFVECANKGMHVVSHEIASHNMTYSVFNREYPWAPSCKQLKEFAWVDAKVKTGEKVSETFKTPYLSAIDAYLKRLGYLSDSDDELFEIEREFGTERLEATDEEDAETVIPEISYREVTREIDVEKEIGEILHATSNLLWEEEYDATKETAISWNVPCAALVESLQLRQLETDGFFYDRDRKLAAFDVRLTQKYNCVVVRKDLLDEFLKMKGMELIWIIDCEKEIHAPDRTVSQWSKWEAVYSYNNDRIDGSLCMIS